MAPAGGAGGRPRAWDARMRRVHETRAQDACMGGEGRQWGSNPQKQRAPKQARALGAAENGHARSRRWSTVIARPASSAPRCMPASRSSGCGAQAGSNRPDSAHGTAARGIPTRGDGAVRLVDGVDLAVVPVVDGLRRGAHRAQHAQRVKQAARAGESWEGARRRATYGRPDRAKRHGAGASWPRQVSGRQVAARAGGGPGAAPTWV